MGNIEVNNRVTSAFNAIVKALKDAGKLDAFKVDAGPGERRHRHQPERSGQRASCRCSSRAATWSAPSPANNVFTPALAKAVAQMGKTGKICAYGFDLGPAQQEAHRRPAT